MDGDGCALHPRPRDQETEETQEWRDERRRTEKASKKAKEKRRPWPPRPSRAGSSRQTGSSATAGTTTRIRQSVLYSDRPRRSRRPSSDKLPVDEHAGEVSSREFEALALGQSRPTLDSTHRVVMHASDVGSGTLDSTIVEPSALKQDVLPQGEGEFEKWFSKIPKFDSFEEAFEYLINSTKAAQAKAREESMVAPEQEIPKSMVPSEQEISTSMVAPEEEIRISMVAPEQEVVTRGQVTRGQEEIARNVKKWMSEEAMVAFKKYMEKRDDSKGFEYQFDKLLCQCINWEHCFKIFRHFNFTVKRRALGSADWTSQLYFAEVKEMFRQKNSICYPLESDEEGDCYSCKSKGMDELRHPLVGEFDRGLEDCEFPFCGEESGSEEEYSDRDPDEESDDDACR